MTFNFVTLGEELIEHAEAFALKMRADGLKVRAEHDDGTQPKLPTLVGSSGKSRHYVEVLKTVKKPSVEGWVSYCKSRSAETSYSIVLPDSSSPIKTDLLAWLRAEGVGIYISGSAGVTELAAPRDLSLNLALPALNGESRALRLALAPIYQLFNRGDWFNGFKDACQLLESRARRALEERVSSSSVSFTSKTGAPKTYSVKQVKKLTLGQLAVAYSEIVLPTAKDQKVARALAEVNPDRVGAVHKSDNRSVRTRLRGKVGVHMWMLVNGLRELM
jgi:hypothetical protein